MAKRLKCIGCNQLRRQRALDPTVDPIYECPRFPYATAISGLMVPSSGITRAAEKCPVDISKGCIICGAGGELETYGGDPFAYTCKVHYRAWSKWLDEHPEKVEAFRPRGRIISSIWIDTFREFVEEARLPEHK